MAEPIQTLESEVNSFAAKLPHWGQFLCEKIISGQGLNDADTDAAYTYLLEDLELKGKTARTAITFAHAAASQYCKDLLFSKLENLVGVNALSENQVLEFCPGLTIVFGPNGAGKSGYIRLLKKSFYSKSPEEIQPNIFATGVLKKVSAEFTFSTLGSEAMLDYPGMADQPEFSQFAVFDGKSVLKHLEGKNQFEFRPAGLSFFATLTDAVRKLESKLGLEINGKQSLNNFTDLFDGDSEVKFLLSGLSGNTKIAVLEKYLPFTDTDVKEKREKQKKYDEILLASRNRQKEIDSLNALKKLLDSNKQAVIAFNRFFSEEHIDKTYKAIEDCLEKQGKAKKEGVENFANEKIKNIGGVEWKNFITATETFARQQSEAYPSGDDSCILCHQPLSKEAIELITKYWSFIKSISERDANDAQDAIDKGIVAFEKLNFALFPDNNTLTDWIEQKFPETLLKLKKELTGLEEMAKELIKDLKDKPMLRRVAAQQIGLEHHLVMEKSIEEKIKLYSEDKVDPEFDALSKSLTLLTHREKLALHFEKIKQFIETQQWILKANKANWGKRNITDAEKNLSAKYFNQKYVDTFNEQCTKMNGDFGITINHTGAAGTSYRQLFIEGKNPASILSEGEQKVIAIADFLAEMGLSEINRGIIFDDPVTSLDHERKENIATHLVEIAANKQVIVFTHDIFFLVSLKYHAEALKISLRTSSLYKNDDLVGMTMPNLPWVAAGVAERCGFLKNELVAITKLHKTADPDTYKFQVKLWCGLLRESWERSVEERLFKGVVSRFSYGVETLRMKYLAVTTELIGIINDGMTRTSKWVHDQAAGQNTPTPKPEDLKLMIDEFEDFIKNKCKAQ